MIQVVAEKNSDKAKIEYHVARYFVHGRVEDMMKAIYYAAHSITIDSSEIHYLRRYNMDEWFRLCTWKFEIDDMDEMCKQLSEEIPEFEHLRVDRNPA